MFLEKPREQTPASFFLARTFPDDIQNTPRRHRESLSAVSHLFLRTSPGVTVITKPQPMKKMSEKQITENNKVA